MSEHELFSGAVGLEVPWAVTAVRFDGGGPAPRPEHRPCRGESLPLYRPLSLAGEAPDKRRL